MNRIEQMVLRFRAVLEETERLGGRRLQDYQHSLLQPLVLHAFISVPYYRDRLQGVCDGKVVDLSRWQDIPVTSRAQAQDHETELRARSLPPHVGTVEQDETSGSTGRPLRFQINQLVNVAALAMTDRLYRWWDLDGSKRMFNFVSPRSDLGLSGQKIIKGWRVGGSDGLHYLQSSTGDMGAHIDRLREISPDYLLAPSGLLEPLAAAAEAAGSPLAFEAILARGGVVSDDLRVRCLSVFNAALIDQYGANEIGQAASQCPHCGEYHICSEAVLVEVLDDHGRPAPPGTVGRLVLTSLYNYAMPFIRYEIGDYAEVGQDAPDCRIKLPTLKRIIGRYRNSFRLRDGRVLFPHPLMSGFRQFFAHSQLQVVQTDFDRLEVRYVPAAQRFPPDRKGLQQWLRAELGHEFDVRLVTVDDLPRTGSGKFEDFVSEVPDPPADRTTGPAS